MITINYNGKTYKPKLSYIDLLDTKAFENCIKQGYLEEVKENKELMENDSLEAIKEFEEYEQSIKDPSILEKLRESLYTMKSQNVDRSEYTQGVLCACDYLPDLLTSLEPQPQEDIELPAFDYDKLHIEAMKHGVTFAVHVAHPLCKQVEILTERLNQLIKANKK